MANNTPKSIREEVLETAIKLTTQDRNKQYGDPGVNMRCFAAMIDVYLHFHGQGGLNRTVNAHDAAMIMALSKVARIAVSSKPHMDNYIDGAAYLAIAAQVSNP